MAMSKRMPFAGYGDAGVASPREPGAGLSKRTRTMSPMTSGGGPGGAAPAGSAAPRVPPPSPLPADIDLTAFMGDNDPASAPLSPATADAYTTPGAAPLDPEGASSPISTILQMILRGQGGRA